MLLYRSSQGEIEQRGDRVVYGVAAPFDQWATLRSSPRVIERIQPGAFDAELERVQRGRAEIRALADHDSTRILGRTGAPDSLKLEADADSLRFALRLPSTSDGNDMLELAQRGLLGGVSIGFDSTATRVQYGLNQLREYTRELSRVALREISLVSSYAAYPNTSVEVKRWHYRIES